MHGIMQTNQRPWMSGRCNSNPQRLHAAPEMETVLSVAGVFEAYFGKRWRAVPLGMSGDTVAYLRWRLEHGEMPRARPPRVAVLLVGTNDLRDAKALYEHQAGADATPEGRSAAVLASARDIGGRCGLRARCGTMHEDAD